jgi:acetyltransferase-like isoleucine patch superfamily enzyme
VVTGHVDDYAIMAGVPARKIGDTRHRKPQLRGGIPHERRDL